jgi:peptide/nickel transport system substrate-binding protein/oligopeptide transport system substrate-binding protein
MKPSDALVHKIALWAMVTLLLFGLGSCCPEDPYKNYLKMVILTEPKSMDPTMANDITTGVISGLMYDNLVQFGIGNDLQPGLAQSWEISSDGRVYTFNLRDDVYFWDGKQLTARDVVYSFHRTLNPETRSSMTWLLDPILGASEFMQGKADSISGIRMINPSKIELILSKPFAPFIGFLAVPPTAIVPYKEGDPVQPELKTTPMGTGAWIFAEWQSDRKLSFKKNPNYFNGPAKLDGILLNNMPETLTQAVEFEAGNLDSMVVPNSEFKYWTRSTAWQPYIQKMDELGIYYLAMNVERTPFTDKRVRQAVTYAIDREKIIHRILHNSATLAHGPIPPGLAGYDSTRVPLPYDPEKAKQLLVEAGYPEQCEFDLWVDPGAAISQTIEAIQHYLNEAGFKVNIVRNDWNMMRDAMRKGGTDAYWGNWWADYADAENFLAPLFHSKNSARRNRYNNSTVDENIESLQQSLDPEERKLLAMNIDSTLIEEAPYAFFWYPTSYTVFQPNLKNFIVHQMYFANKYTEVYFEEQG